jgi:hypothetical protein
MKARLSKSERALLVVLGRLFYTTPEILEGWGIARYTTSRCVKPLLKNGYITVNSEVSPNIIGLTHKGAAVVDRELPNGKGYKSWGAVSHRCRRNAAEILLRKHHERFTFNSRQYAYTLGLNPANREHIAVDEAGTRYLVIIDDYLMQPRRIAHCWDRPHTPNKRYYHDLSSRRWRDVVSRLVVVTTDNAQVPRYEKVLEKSDRARQLLDSDESLSNIRDELRLKTTSSVRSFAELPKDIEIFSIPPIWDIV